MKKLKLWLSISLILIVSTLSCSFFSRVFGVTDQPAERTEPVVVPAEVPESAEIDHPGSFSAITFCEDVTDEGECIQPGEFFPAGIQRVWAYFTYQDMQPGQSWGRYWTLDGEMYVDATGESWEDDSDGWMAYSIEGEHELDGGEYRLVLYLDDQPVQEATFQVETAAPVSFSVPAFGPIDFTTDIEQEYPPVQSITEFEAGFPKLYGVFAFTNMTDQQSWTCEWLWNGETLVSVDSQWEYGEQGLTYCSYENDDGSDLTPGEYTLNLNIEEQIARSASANVLGEQAQTNQGEPALPEEIISAELLKGWEMLNDVSFEPLHEIAQLALIYHVPISIDENMSWYGGVYSVDDCNAQPRVAGSISFSRKFYDDQPWETIAALIGHELVHAGQHMEKGQCGCYLYNEVQAYQAQIYTYKELGVEDWIYEKWGHVFGDDGRFDQDLLWEWVDENYVCPAYAP